MLVKKKSLVIAMLATVCLTAASLMIIPISKQPGPPTGLEVNVVNTQLDVNVTNWASQYKELSFTFNISWADYHGNYFAPFMQAAYSRMFVIMSPEDISEGADAVVDVTLESVYWAPEPSVNYGQEWIMWTLQINRIDQAIHWNRPVPYEMKVKATYFMMIFTVDSTVPSGSILMETYVYFRNE